MKFLKLALFAGLSYAAFLLVTTPVVSCTKTYTDSTHIKQHIVFRDTTIIRDTTFVHDTTTVRDTMMILRERRPIR